MYHIIHINYKNNKYNSDMNQEKIFLQKQYDICIHNYYEYRRDMSKIIKHCNDINTSKIININNKTLQVKNYRCTKDKKNHVCNYKYININDKIKPGHYNEFSTFCANKFVKYEKNYVIERKSRRKFRDIKYDLLMPICLPPDINMFLICMILDKTKYYLPSDLMNIIMQYIGHFDLTTMWFVDHNTINMMQKFTSSLIERNKIIKHMLNEEVKEIDYYGITKLENGYINNGHIITSYILSIPEHFKNHLEYRFRMTFKHDIYFMPINNLLFRNLLDRDSCDIFGYNNYKSITKVNYLKNKIKDIVDIKLTNYKMYIDWTLSAWRINNCGPNVLFELYNETVLNVKRKEFDYRRINNYGYNVSLELYNETDAELNYGRKINYYIETISQIENDINKELCDYICEKGLNATVVPNNKLYPGGSYVVSLCHEANELITLLASTIKNYDEVIYY